MQPKKCLLCGCLDEGGDAKTCPYCGEATWKHVDVGAKLGVEVVELGQPVGDVLGESIGEPIADAQLEVVPAAPKKRGGRRAASA